MISRRSFIALASGLLVPEPTRVYSFAGGWAEPLPRASFNGIEFPSLTELTSRLLNDLHDAAEEAGLAGVTTAPGSALYLFATATAQVAFDHYLEARIVGS